jgi:hypothetical protein
VRGEDVCQQVPKTEQVCVDHLEKECANIPAKEACKNIPYQEHVCKMETLQRDEPYECMKKVQVPHEVTLKTQQAHVQIEFDAQSSQVESSYNVALDTKGNLTFVAKKRENSHVIAFANKQVKTEQHGDINSINALYKIVLFDLLENFKFIESGIQNIELHKKVLAFTVEGKLDAKRIKLDVRIRKKEEVKLEKSLSGSQVLAEFDGEKTKVTLDLEKLGALKIGGIFNRTHNIHLKLKLDYADLGEVLLSEGKELSTEANVDLKIE